jgi:hypothetical protein
MTHHRGSRSIEVAGELAAPFPPAALWGRRLCLVRAGLRSRLWSRVWLGLRPWLRCRPSGPGWAAPLDGIATCTPDGRDVSADGGWAAHGGEHPATSRPSGSTAARAKRRAATHRNEARGAPVRRPQHGGEQRPVLPARRNLVSAVLRNDRGVLRGRAGSLTQRVSALPLARISHTQPGDLPHGTCTARAAVGATSGDDVTTEEKWWTGGELNSRHRNFQSCR